MSLTRLGVSLRERECHITVVNQVIRLTERTAAEQLEMRERGGDALLTENVVNLLKVRGKPYCKGHILSVTSTFYSVLHDVQIKCLPQLVFTRL